MCYLEGYFIWIQWALHWNDVEITFLWSRRTRAANGIRLVRQRLHFCIMQHSPSVSQRKHAAGCEMRRECIPNGSGSRAGVMMCPMQKSVRIHIQQMQAHTHDERLGRCKHNANDDCGRKKHVERTLDPMQWARLLMMDRRYNLCSILHAFFQQLFPACRNARHRGGNDWKCARGAAATPSSSILLVVRGFCLSTLACVRLPLPTWLALRISVRSDGRKFCTPPLTPQRV